MKTKNISLEMFRTVDPASKVNSNRNQKLPRVNNIEKNQIYKNFVKILDQINIRNAKRGKSKLEKIKLIRNLKQQKNSKFTNQKRSLMI